VLRVFLVLLFLAAALFLLLEKDTYPKGTH